MNISLKKRNLFNSPRLFSNTHVQTRSLISVESTHADLFQQNTSLKQNKKHFNLQQYDKTYALNCLIFFMVIDLFESQSCVNMGRIVQMGICCLSFLDFKTKWFNVRDTVNISTSHYFFFIRYQNLL